MRKIASAAKLSDLHQRVGPVGFGSCRSYGLRAGGGQVDLWVQARGSRDTRSADQYRFSTCGWWISPGTRTDDAAG
jgi:hypothetical protein